jgi:hypothetical protein
MRLIGLVVVLVLTLAPLGAAFATAEEGGGVVVSRISDQP